MDLSMCVKVASMSAKDASMSATVATVSAKESQGRVMNALAATMIAKELVLASRTPGLRP